RSVCGRTRNPAATRCGWWIDPRRAHPRRPRPAIASQRIVRRIEHSKHVEHCNVVLALVRLFETRVAHVSQGDFKPRADIGPRESATQLFGEIQTGAVQVIRLGLVSAAQAKE